MEKDLLTLRDISREETYEVLDLADTIKACPDIYSGRMKNKTLLMIFEKPSLRTRLSFEAGMTQMGGHAIYYDISTSPMGKKESVGDTAKASSRYVDIIMARMYSHADLEGLARSSSVPVINALTNFSHPCQILADLMTIKEKKDKLEGLVLAYVGDCDNNVTHSLMYGCTKMGIETRVACPEGFEPKDEVQLECPEVKITQNPKEAVKDADIVYTDSWMSYHIEESQKEERIEVFQPYQVNLLLMEHAKKDAVFMNCLPAIRGMEQTAEVIDGPQSIVFDQAENRLHVQKALMLKLLKLD